MAIQSKHNEDDEYLQSLSWMDEHEGQLSVDVVETNDKIIVRSAIAGVTAENLDISATTDTLTIRGKREAVCDEGEYATTHIQECYWGGFSRSIILPSPVRPDAADAVLKNGILTVSIPKTELSSNVNIIELE